MGFFTGAKKEYYINRLVKSFKIYYGCGDMAAIECLRKNYSAQEIKNNPIRIRLMVYSNQ